MTKIIKERMCVACRGRFRQDSLLRLQIVCGKVVAFHGFGRSFYLCESCLESKNCEKIIGKIFKIDNAKEIAQIWQNRK